ncbi:MAG: glutamine synthetase catalytic region [Oscillospiraceae bacterium]|nr:glutamine synthetase catalytic region [Oscillospiraceae bacterium]
MGCGKTSSPDAIFGEYVFSETVMKARLSKAAFKVLKATVDAGKSLDTSVADEVASAMKEWAIEKGATHFTHWFQPMTGITAEKHDAFISPVGDGRVVMEFSGKELIKGEPDASSFPSGGLRETAAARGYTAWDCTSPAFVKDGTLYIPTAFFSYTGEILDKKAPLLRSVEVLSSQALRVLKALGNTTSKKVIATVGPEQEYFLVNRTQYEKRLDLLLTGRTLFGAMPPKGQELEDQYFGRLRIKIGEFMHDLDTELWKLGITAKTKHNEVAPAQHELAIIFDPANVAADHNLLVMETMKTVAKKHGLAALLHEKPFAGVNGSGKHINWSVATDDGINLLDPGTAPIENPLFLIFLASVIKAVDEYAALLRLSVASAGNDHRLGANEAPPAIISIFVGEELDAIIKSIISGNPYSDAGRVQTNLGVSSLPVITEDSTDRNRTSPFAFTGNKFEFRMCGSANNIAEPCFVLNTVVAQILSEVADTLEKATDAEAEAKALIKDFLTAHERVIFNGNGYSDAWVEEAAKRGLPNIGNTVLAIKELKSEKSKAVFTGTGVLNEKELESRYEILLENYTKTINIEALTLIDMMDRQLLPATLGYSLTLAEIAEKAGSQSAKNRLTSIVSLADDMDSKLTALKSAVASGDGEDAFATALYYRESVVSAMEAARTVIDEVEKVMPADVWPVPVYSDMLFRV